MKPTSTLSKIPVGTLLLGKYKVAREIGRGGMAAIYEAEQVSLGKRVAIKVLAAELSASTIVIERFFREARAAASIKSPYIVDIYDSGRLEDGRPFIAMELLEGESLYDRMARERILDAQTAVRIITQSAKGLTKAHAAGIVHRDLKPENIFLVRTEEGNLLAKILDFGLAKFYEPVEIDQKSARLTREGAIFGTPAYMSPEQVRGHGSVDHRSDLWALGCMTYECLIGRPVWNTDQGVAMTFAAIVTSPLPVPSQIRPDLPAAFDEWFAKALRRDAAQRFQSARELAEALARSFGGDFLSVESFPGGAGAAEMSFQNSRGALPDSSQPHLNTDSSGGARRLNVREPGLSGMDLPHSAHPRDSGPPKKSSSRFVWAGGLLVGSVAIAVFAWLHFNPPSTGRRESPLASPPSSIASSPPPSVPNEVGATPPKWTAMIIDGQRALSAGDFAGALQKFKEASDQGGASTTKPYFEQTKIALASKGPCRLAAFAHPRTGATGNAGRPSVASLPKGAVVSWTDDHEQPGHDHAYSVVIDEAGVPLSAPRDLTPEANDVGRASLYAADGRTVLLYWDKSGREAGVRARFIDENGHIGGASILVGAARPGTYWPTLAKSADGYFVAWQDDRDKDGDDLFMRHLAPSLDSTGPEIRLTDYPPERGHISNARLPGLAATKDAIFVVFKLERDSEHLIERMRIPLGSHALSTGLDERPTGSRARRDLATPKVVNEDRLGGDAPSIACNSESCFVAWHGERGGAYAARVETEQGRVLWRKRFAIAGTHPTLSTGRDGQLGVVYFENGKVKVATVSEDGVGVSSVVAKVTGDQPRPWLAPGAVKGEWYIAWQDFEAPHTEACFARVVCSP